MVHELKLRGLHLVECWHCKKRFNLPAAAWCGCGVNIERPSKVCPHCLQCICLHPDYDNPLLWGDAPKFLKHQGFARFFYLYL
jgi:hypothetical protein